MGTPAESGPADKPAVAKAGARFPSAKYLEKYLEQPGDEPEPVVPPPSQRKPRPEPRELVEGHEEVPGPRVRPYVLTKGRTHTAFELRLETMVSLRADARWEGQALGAEYQPVRALCISPLSVAEVAVNLSLPLGVARVLLSDMAELGLLHIHGTERTSEGRPPVALMHRVLEGLMRL